MVLLKLKRAMRPVFYAAVLLLPAVLGCRGMLPPVEVSGVVKEQDTVQRMGYAIQAGAFSNVDNAARLTATLQVKGLEAYYFLHDSGLFKVRFGNYQSLEAAVLSAQQLRGTGTIEDYYIVKPEEYQGLTPTTIDNYSLRKGIVLSSKRFIGVPYKWGGISDQSGFDCSGLAMAVYQLNGLTLPRTSNQQYRAGIPVSAPQLLEGDLVFFATEKPGLVSHVGIYVGDGNFIHAPREGKKIRVDSLANKYFQDRFQGGRTYFKG